VRAGNPLVSWRTLLPVSIRNIVGSLRRPALARERPIAVSIVAVAAVLSVASFAFFLANRMYLVGSDTFYYIAIADSIHETGQTLDITSDPPLLLKTPQNGVVALYFAMSAIGIRGEAALIALTVLNYLIFAASALALVLLARRMGIRWGAPMAVIVAGYFGAYHIYRVQLLPINDGIFNPLVLMLVLLLAFELDNARRGRDELTSRGTILRWVAILALSSVLVHFKINALLVAGSAAIAAGLALDRKTTAVAFVACLAAVASLGTVYLAVDTSRMASVADDVAGGLGTLGDNARVLATETVPDLFLLSLGRWGKLLWPVISLSVAAAIVLTAVLGRRKKEHLAVFLAMVCATGILATGALSFQSYRYVVYLLPVLLVLLVRSGPLRYVAYGIVALMMLSTAVSLYRGYERSPQSEYWLYLVDNPVALPSHAPVLSDESRHVYFFLGAPTHTAPLTWETIVERGGVVIVGNAEFRSQRLAEITALVDRAGGGALTVDNLTPGYSDGEGNGTVLVRRAVP